MSVERGYSIPEWCELRGICRASFYNHKGRMPRSIKIGARRIITAEEDAAWMQREIAATEAADAQGAETEGN